jgi:hypothetical protein
MPGIVQIIAEYLLFETVHERHAEFHNKHADKDHQKDRKAGPAVLDEVAVSQF